MGTWSVLTGLLRGSTEYATSKAPNASLAESCSLLVGKLGKEVQGRCTEHIDLSILGGAHSARHNQASRNAGGRGTG